MVGFGCVIGFAIVEARVASPMVPLTLFRSRSFGGANLLTLFLYAAVGVFFFLLPLNLIQVQGYSATAAGAAMLPFILLMFLLSRWAGGLVARYGPRVPLLIGPLIAALGFILFAVPSVGDSYWREFFPAAVVLGFGMTVTVAPLTTVVMNSVDQDRAGTASGINNAIARVAGVLAIAALGIVMVDAFGFRMDRSLTHLPLPPRVVQEIQAEKIKLGGLPLPDGLDPNTKVAVRQSIEGAFVFGFRIVMLICAGLSLASAAVAAVMIWDGIAEGRERGHGPASENR
jgi:MFS family permease